MVLNGGSERHSANRGRDFRTGRIDLLTARFRVRIPTPEPNAFWLATGMQLSVLIRRAAATSLASCAKLPSRKCVQADARGTSAHWWPMSPCLSPLEGSRPWSPDPARRRRARRAGTLLERNQRPAGYQERRELHSALGRDPYQRFLRL